MFRRIRNYLLGEPLTTKAISREKLTRVQGLAIFASDSLSSTAYATEEILLALGGGSGIASLAALLFTSIPISIAIGFLILIVTVSYKQVIYAYPEGGGVYNVAKSNLGEYPSIIGAASLLIDYVLTSAVSTVAGVAAITSAFPFLFSHKVAISILIIALLMWINLRGIRESGRIFALPTYLFIFSFFGMIAYGVWELLSGDVSMPEFKFDYDESFGAIGAVLALRAFAAGCTAMTGIEAVSNGVQSFEAPEPKNASKTLMRMALILISLFLGITFLSYIFGIEPKTGETVISQIARSLFGYGPIYLLIQGATAMILLLAANTPFAGFPGVASQLAKDSYFPRQFRNLGSRLVFANGIILLSAFTATFIILFNADLHKLIPLYAVGVFLGFSLSQLGMIMHWMRKGVARHAKSIGINFIGFLSTSFVFVIVLVSKFEHGAWLLLPSLFFLVMFMKIINNYYRKIDQKLALYDTPVPDTFANKTMVLLVPTLDRGSLYALTVARSFKPVRLRAVHVAIDEGEGKILKSRWEKYAPDVPIDILFSEYRDLIHPVIDHLKDIENRWQNDSVVFVMPEVVPEKLWHHILHNKTNARLRFEINSNPNIHAEILEVPVKINSKF